MGGGQGFVGGFGVGLTTTGGTITGGTTTGGTTTVTGGTLTGSGTEIVTVTGFDRVGGWFDPVLGEGVDEVPATDVEAVGVTTGAVGVMTVGGAGLADGVGVLVAECSFGTMMSGLPPPVCGAEPK